MFSLDILQVLAEVLHTVECRPGARELAAWSPGHIAADQARAKAIAKDLAARGLQIERVGDGDDLTDDVLPVAADAVSP